MLTWLFLKILNMEASSSRSRPREIIEKLRIQEGCTVADLGSGGGYFTLEFARRVGRTGRVFAVDVKPKYLDLIRRQSQHEGLNNIAFVTAENEGVELPEESIDLVFVRNTFHHLSERVEYFRNFKKFLKPDGKAAIIEYKAKGRLSFATLFKHYTPAEVIRREMEAAGYSLVQSFDVLPEQSFLIFQADRAQEPFHPAGSE